VFIGGTEAGVMCIYVSKGGSEKHFLAGGRLIDPCYFHLHLPSNGLRTRLLAILEVSKRSSCRRLCNHPITYPKVVCVVQHNNHPSFRVVIRYNILIGIEASCA